ncbi:hypothetical protein CTI12_AA500620 [Artemisia annua]|uniref:Uncharacterized protein n=1 Tax=Artemisia annua TaxID=35608 RepID=A0A2U1LEF8_ARTAN|nr:hypothetical protein CTI12_AA500620 [Artemisia annua]
MANVNLKDREADIVAPTLQALLNSVDNLKVVELPTEKLSPSIQMVPNKFRDISPGSFNPRVVSIGPLHRDDEHLQPFENQKAGYMRSLIRRVYCSRVQTLDACVRKVAASIDKIKACYDEMKPYADVELAKMMVMDACFILEFCYRISDCDDSVPAGNISLAQSIIRDLVLVENQIPFFVLNDLFECTILALEPDSSVTDFIFPALKLITPFEGKLRIFDHDTSTNYNHVLDILHKSYKPNSNKEKHASFFVTTSYTTVELAKAGVNFKPNQNEPGALTMEFQSSYEPNYKKEIHTSFFVPTSYTAVELAKAGVNFKPNQNEPGALTMEFQSSTFNPTFTMPILRIEEYTESVLRNLIAYEQSFLNVGNHVTSYAVAMMKLIDTKEDLLKLVESKIVANHPSGHQYIVDMIQGLCQEVVLKEFSYGQSWRKMDEYCNSGLGWIRRTYFTGTWSYIASVSGLILFLLTAIQTYCAIRSL